MAHSAVHDGDHSSPPGKRMDFERSFRADDSATRLGVFEFHDARQIFMLRRGEKVHVGGDIAACDASAI